MQVGPQRHLSLSSIGQTVNEICTFPMLGFPVSIPFSVFWSWSSPKVVDKINKGASLHTLQLYIRTIVYLDYFLILG